ncbi:MAG: hypothetical protein GY747_07950 [Planctomycetes bacterium]|nr:hypothetical protein [Planctomycetota bacterium]MCP4770771.1 hypothetical protein [Planctomycetota bacterium]MCP4862158.1 hypothetical protein [Planctomycetota bacterium]
MEGGLLTTPEFSTFSEKVVPFLHVTTRIEGRANEKLLSEKGGRGFPTLMFLDAEGEILGEPGGRDVASFDKTLGALTAIKDLEKRIAAGEKNLKDDLFMAQLAMGQFKTVAEIEEKAKSFKKLTKEQKATIAKAVVGKKVEEAMNNMERGPEGQAKLGKKFKAIYEEGIFPEGDMEGPFWGFLMEYAETERDAKTMKVALDHVKRIFGKEEWAKGLIEEKEASLKEIQEGGAEVVEEEVVEEVVEG